MIFPSHDETRAKAILSGYSQVYNETLYALTGQYSTKTSLVDRVKDIESQGYTLIGLVRASTTSTSNIGALQG